MKRSYILIMMLLALLAFAAVPVLADPGHAGDLDGAGGGTPGTSMNFELVGHNPLFNRGMNAAPAIFDHFLYVGNRTDGSSRCGIGDPRRETTGLDSCPHEHPGVLILDINNPANPTVVGEIGPPHAGVPGITTRELRVWPEKKLLMIMTFRCSAVIHACVPSPQIFDIKFFDLSDPVHPQFLSRYVPTTKNGAARVPHEMFLWIDPKDPNRALLWLSLPTTSVDPNRPNLMIVDISNVPSGGPVTEVAEGNWNQLYPGAENPANYDFDLAVHSIGVSVDGMRTYLAYLRGHFLVVDTSDLANDAVPPGTVLSLNDKLLTPIENRPRWGTADGGCLIECAESHSAVKFPGRPFALVTDEVYGTFTVPSFGCPWGWARTINVAQPRRPHILGEYKIAQNACPADDPLNQQFASYSSHNPTLTRNVALIAWHSGGLQAIDISDPGLPVQAGWFSPTPLDSVATEDPALSRGANKVVMWSYPIVRSGLIYVVDIRNGLYVLRYSGPHAAEVNGLTFLEGNSNLGDAVRIDKSARP